MSAIGNDSRYNLPLKLEPQATDLDDFRRLRNLTATLTANIVGMKQDMDNRGMAFETI